MPALLGPVLHRLFVLSHYMRNLRSRTAPAQGIFFLPQKLSEEEAAAAAQLQHTASGASAWNAAGTWEERPVKLAWVQEQLGELLSAVAHSHQGARVAVEEVTSCRWVLRGQPAVSIGTACKLAATIWCLERGYGSSLPGRAPPWRAAASGGMASNVSPAQAGPPVEACQHPLGLPLGAGLRSWAWRPLVPEVPSPCPPLTLALLCSGEAHQWFVRGRKRAGFELALEFRWRAELAGAVVSGTAK